MVSWWELTNSVNRDYFWLFHLRCVIFFQITSDTKNISTSLLASSTSNVFIIRFSPPSLCHFLLLWVNSPRYWVRLPLIAVLRPRAQSALHSVFCTRMLLRIRKTGRKSVLIDDVLTDLDPPTYAWLLYSQDILVCKNYIYSYGKCLREKIDRLVLL